MNNNESITKKVREAILDKVPNLDEDDIESLVDELSDAFSGSAYNDDQGRGYYNLANINEHSSASVSTQSPVPTHYENANLVGSKTRDGFHKPVLDMDFPISVRPSLTEGHYHLYIDKQITNEQMNALLQGMKEAKLLQAGYVRNFDQEGQVFVRTQRAINEHLDHYNGGRQFEMGLRF